MAFNNNGSLHYTSYNSIVYDRVGTYHMCFKFRLTKLLLCFVFPPLFLFILVLSFLSCHAFSLHVLFRLFYSDVILVCFNLLLSSH